MWEFGRNRSLSEGLSWKRGSTTVLFAPPLGVRSEKKYEFQRLKEFIFIEFIEACEKGFFLNKNNSINMALLE